MFRSSFNLNSEGEEKGKPMAMTIENMTGGMLNKTFPGIVGTSIKSYDVLMTVIGILWRYFKQSAFDRYGAIQVHNIHVQRRLLDSKHGHRGPPYWLEFLSVGSPKHIPTSPSSRQSAVFKLVDQRRSVLPHDFSYVYGALHRYRVPVQGPSLAV